VVKFSVTVTRAAIIATDEELISQDKLVEHVNKLFTECLQYDARIVPGVSR